MNTFKSVVFRLTLAAVSAGAAFGQQSGGNSGPFDQSATLNWPSGYGTPGSAGRIVRGRITTNELPDAIVLVGTQPTILYQPGLYSAFEQVPRNASDIEVLPYGGSSGRDALLVVNSTGLESIVKDPGTGNYVATTVVAGAWAGATKVRCGAINAATGAYDIVALASDQHTILVRIDGTDISSWSTTATVLDVALLHWATAATLDVALLTSAGIEIHKYNNASSGGYPFYFANSGVGGDAMAVVHNTSASSDALAWIYHVSNRQKLTVLRNGSAPEPAQTLPTDVGNRGFALTTGDVDGDGLDDLIVNDHQSCAPLYVVGKTSGTLTYDLSASTTQTIDAVMHTPGGNSNIYYLSTMDGTANTATPLLCDLDADGHVDLVLAVPDVAPSPLMRFLILTGKRPQESPPSIHFFSSLYGQEGCPIGVDYLNPAFRFSTWSTIVSGDSVRVAVWKQPTSTVEQIDVNSTSSYTTAGSDPDILTLNPNVSTYDLYVPCSIDPGGFVNGSNHVRWWFLIQALHVDSNGTTVKESRVGMLMQGSQQEIDNATPAGSYSTPASPFFFLVNCVAGAGQEPVAILESRRLPITNNNQVPPVIHTPATVVAAHP